MAHATSQSPPAPLAPLALHGLSVEGVNQCVHCGLCLASCPTFAELGTEMDSPRGRIFLIKALAEGRIGLTDPTVTHLELCLDCRACETACPAGVPYGSLIEAAKAEIERQRPGGIARRAFRWLNFRLLLGHPRMLSAAAAGLRFYQSSGLQWLIRRTGLARLLPGAFSAWEALLPRVPAATERRRLAFRHRAPGGARGSVHLLEGCIQRVMFGAHNVATVRVLLRNGWNVDVPDTPCCGALHAHAGDHAGAVGLARKAIDAFFRGDTFGVGGLFVGARNVVIANTSGCGAHMRAYGTLLADDPEYAERARHFASCVQDISEFLAREPLRGPLAPVPMTVTYHDPCHVVHGQKIRRPPRELLAQVPGLRVVDLPESDWCCGSAGIYNLTQPEMADRLLRRKVLNIEATKAQAVVTANPGCILQIQAGLRTRGLDLPVLHLVEILDRAYTSEGACVTAPSDASPRIDGGGKAAARTR